MADPFDPMHSLDCVRNETLTYLALQEVQALRSVCKRWKEHCTDFKTYFLEVLDNTNQTSVRLVGLKDKRWNDKIGITKKENKRYLVTLLSQYWLTGEYQTVCVEKICNLHPFCSTTPAEPPKTNEVLEYTHNAKLRVSHSMLLDQLLMLARWESNSIQDYLFKGSYETFCSLPRNDLIIGRLNSFLFTWWRNNPNLVGITAPGSICDAVARSVMDTHEEISKGLTEFSKGLTKQDISQKWNVDGPSGRDMVRNFLRFMRSWEQERITGYFFVVGVYKTGTIMVHVESIEDGEDVSLGKVYLVKGHNAAVGELRKLPFYCHATLLPIYNIWTYDGIVIEFHCNKLTNQLQDKLNEYVDEAIERNLVCWKSSLADYWMTTPPPIIPSIVSQSKNEVVMDWHDESMFSNSKIETNYAEETISEEHLEMGRKIAQKVNIDANGGSLIFRRDGYSLEENPNGTCMILYNHDGQAEPVRNFQCTAEKDHFDINENDDMDAPTYNLKGVLEGIIKSLEYIPNLLPGCILLDELAIVRPLNEVLEQCFREANKRSLTIEWYPPLSPEERAFAKVNGANYVSNT